MPNTVASEPVAPPAVAVPPHGGELPPPYVDVAREALLRPTPEHNPHGFGKPPSFLDPRFTDPPVDRLYPPWRTPPIWALNLAGFDVKGAMAMTYDNIERSKAMTDLNAMVHLFNLSVLIALSSEPAIPRAHAALEPRALQILSGWCGDLKPLGDDVRERCRATVIEFVRLLAALVGTRDLGADMTFDALRLSDSPDHPPLLHAMASLAARDTNAAVALCDLFSAFKERMLGRPEFVARVNRTLLGTQEPRGLPPGDKYASFYGRVFGDGAAAGRPGAPIVAYRLGRLGFMPTPSEVTATHSAIRAAKWALCCRRGDDWGRGSVMGPQGDWNPVACAARLFQRTRVENQWAKVDPQHFAAKTVVPEAPPSRFERSRLSSWFRSTRLDGASTPSVTRSTAPSPNAPAR